MSTGQDLPVSVQRSYKYATEIRFTDSSYVMLHIQILNTNLALV